MAAPISPLHRFVQQWTVLLTTYRRDGSAVGTPVNIAISSGRAYIRSWDTAGKVKRIRNHSEVEVAPSTRRGKVTGPPIRARARILSDEESGPARKAIEQKYPIVQRFLVPLAHRLGNKRTIHMELTPITE